MVNKMRAMAWKRLHGEDDTGCDTYIMKRFWRHRNCFRAAVVRGEIQPVRSTLFATSLSYTSVSFSPTGYFTQISTLADVQENVMEYLHVLSRPKVIDQEHDTVWTEAYIDSTVSRPCRVSLGTTLQKHALTTCTVQAPKSRDKHRFQLF